MCAPNCLRMFSFLCVYLYNKYGCVCVLCSEAAAHAVATLAEATLQGGGQIVLAETAAAVGALAGVQDATGTHKKRQLFFFF